MAMGDVASGEKVFKKCAACHSIVKVEKIKLVQLYIMLLEEKLG
jgi:cytochrome c